MKHLMHLKSEPFEAIRSGRKTYELRLNDEKRALLQIGDIIEFTRSNNKKDSLRTRVVGLHHYPDFAALYAALPLDKCGYSPNELATASPADMERYYSPEEQKRFGVVAIELELLDRDSGERTAISRYLSYILRHHPEDAGVTPDEQGWCPVSALLTGVQKKHPDLDRPMLEQIVAEDDKQRFAFSSDGTMIRANQGHTLRVNVEMEECEPPEFLWHGTAKQFVESILRNGISPRSRLHVHLTEDRRVAIQSGLRHGEPVALMIRAAEMYRDGYRFYLSANGVWLTYYVPSCYIKR